MESRGGRFCLRPAEHEAAGKNVVQGLLFLRESCNEVAHQECQTGNHFCEIAQRGARERNALSVQIRDVQPQGAFTRSGLPDRGLERSVIQQAGGDRDRKCDRCKLRQRRQRSGGRVRKFNESGWVEGRDQAKNKGYQYGINQIGNSSQPKPRESRAWRQ